MLKKIIYGCFLLLFFLTPLLFTSLNNELFEYNKMMFVYLITVVVTGCWGLLMVRERKILVKRTILDIPMLLFLGANIVSTILSKDIHTSFWGYYTRSNGGLLSIICYVVLYFGLVANINKEQVLKLFKVGVWGGFLVSLYAIPEHFGVSPSCVLLYHQFSADCWIQDVQARVFATLGQPNWLAAYMSMLIFIGMYLIVTAKNKVGQIIYSIITVSMYLAFVFSYSRGGSLGLFVGFGVFPILLLGICFWTYRHFKTINVFNWFKKIVPAAVAIILATLIFGSSLWGFRLLTPTSAPARPNIVGGAASGTQLENGGTESGQIRLIVWKGALEIFKKYPIFGSGVETFAYAYYQVRPREHNLVSEWDFLYNKAHNEYLNYLATTGIAGFATYMLVIGVFGFWIVRKIYELLVKLIKGKGVSEELVFYLCIIGAYVSYLIQNLFGFSVVIIALFFYLFPAMAIIHSDEIKDVKTNKGLFHSISQFYMRMFHSRRKLSRILRVSLQVIIVVLMINYIFLLGRLWYADTLYARGSALNDRGSLVGAYQALSKAVALNSGEPLYGLEKGYSGAGIAVNVSDDASLSAQLAEESNDLVTGIINQYPENITYLRSAIRTYFELASIDPTFNQKTLSAFDKAIALAPTDPKLYYNKGLILGSLDKNEEALNALNQAIDLKPNYRDAYISKAAILLQMKKPNEAKEVLEQLLSRYPGDKEIQDKIDAISNGK